MEEHGRTIVYLMFIGLMQANPKYARIISKEDGSFIAALYHPYLDAMLVGMPKRMAPYITPDIPYDPEHSSEDVAVDNEASLLVKMADRIREHGIIVAHTSQ